MRGGAVGLTHKKVEAKKIGSDGKSYYVYLLLCNDGSYYTGYTNNVASRFERHKKGHGARYTRMRRPKEVAYVERCRTRRTAIRRERQIKRLSHKEKNDLTSIGSAKKAELTDS
jgi:putative endonuclease